MLNKTRPTSKTCRCHLTVSLTTEMSMCHVFSFFHFHSFIIFIRSFMLLHPLFLFYQQHVKIGTHRFFIYTFGFLYILFIEYYFSFFLLSKCSSLCLFQFDLSMKFQMSELSGYTRTFTWII